MHLNMPGTKFISKISVITQLQVPAYVTMYFLLITIMAKVVAKHSLLEKNSKKIKM